MSRSNGGVNAQAVALLDVGPRHLVLEVGFGSGDLAPAIVGLARGVRYVGVDWSPAMVAHARAAHADLVAKGQARFLEGSSERLAGLAAVDRALAVNVIYFWDDPEAHLTELARALSPDGRLVLAFGEADFMRDLPFVAHGFRVYTQGEVEALAGRCGLVPEETRRYEEQERGNDGEVHHKRFVLLRLRRTQR